MAELKEPSKWPTPKSPWVAAFLLDLAFEVLHGGIFHSMYLALIFFAASSLVVLIIWFLERQIKKIK
jgi:hypothetical protein